MWMFDITPAKRWQFVKRDCAFGIKKQRKKTGIYAFGPYVTTTLTDVSKW